MKAIAIVCLSTTLAYAQSIKQADSLYAASDWKNAVPVYESVLNTSPDNALAWNRLGYSYHNLRNYEKAMSSYTKALQNKPAPQLEATVDARLARIHSIKKENEKAFEMLQKAISLGYVNLQEMETNDDFKNIRNDKRFAESLKAAKEKAFPCTVIPQAREFDFWIGEWDVFANGSTVQVGKSKVNAESGGCMILENWTALGPVPNTGKSMNYVNTVTGKWEQFWIGSGGLSPANPQKFVNGEYRDGAMRFEFEQVTPQNQKRMGRFIFFNMAPDQVRQFNEVSSDGGKTWSTVYDFIYKRRK